MLLFHKENKNQVDQDKVPENMINSVIKSTVLLVLTINCKEDELKMKNQSWRIFGPL